MDAMLFQRDGTPAPKGRVVSFTEKGRPFFTKARPCSRCGGDGGADKWAHTGWTCYGCGGSGTNGTMREPLYRADRLTALNATRAKRDARRVAAYEAKQVVIRAETDQRRAAFEAEHGDVLPWLRAAVQVEAERQDYTPEQVEGFLPDMLRRAEGQAEWTEAQAAGVRKAMAARQAQEAMRAASQHVGEVGQRLAVAVTVERISTYARAQFGAAWKTETVYIVTMRDDAGNALVSKSPSFCPEKGASLTIKATVKTHTDFRGEAQTDLARVEDVAAAATCRAAAKALKAQMAAEEIARAAKHEMGGGVSFSQDFYLGQPDAVLVQDFRHNSSLCMLVVCRGDAWLTYDYSKIAARHSHAGTWAERCEGIEPEAAAPSYAAAASALLSKLHGQAPA